MNRGRGDNCDVAEAIGAPAQDRLDQYFRSHAGWLGRTIRKRFAGSAIEIEDIVQEAFVRLARYAEARRDERPRALLVQIASNLARDALRRGRHRDPGREDTIGAPIEAMVAADQHEQALLKQIILALPPLYREVFLLSRFTAMSYAEIARHCGISVKTVEWRMSKALAMCQAALDRA